MKNQYYKILDALKEKFKQAGVNTITFGDTSDIDIANKNIYPILHISPIPITMGIQTTILSFTLVIADMVDFEKEGGENEFDKKFYGKDNMQDVLQDLLGLSEGAITEFHNMNHELPLSINFPIQFQPFLDDLEEVISGYVFDLDIEVKNLC